MRTREENRLRAQERRTADPARARAEARRWVRENPLRAWLHKLRSSARRRGLAFTLTLEQLSARVREAGERCPCCDIRFVPLGRANRKNRNRGRSADRLNNRREYSYREVRIICRRCNTVKGDATAQEHEQVLRYMERGF